MSRIDYYDDPAAPTANSLVPAVSAVVRDERGRVLLQRRRDNDLWALPGGAMEIGESVGQAVAREVEEEAGYLVEPVYVIGVYSDPRHVFAYDDGEVRQEFSVCVAAEVRSGRLRVSDESTEVGWFTPDEAADLEMHPRIRVRLTDGLAGVRAAVA
ncbi:ADP-ribose pyrophosphatase YjhB (NUDIX family) [Krasilnikovia cinnamomea]|uniref:ADP-ribose pyrophosphatase YjhB (NUDIX family) n=1 Tax=Krasilnikovia cinnamomea TaxID=349313 RepID=A0A4Q7ZLI4_9ACTN|nr:NUDIX domain-containing protein [Krasilnikovia cinnamomea]RZU51828.1 ADP-ribose pyrophosphatase YjhB (NUDIX family) [Krasilnikovia cinnamomea]